LDDSQRDDPLEIDFVPLEGDEFAEIGENRARSHESDVSDSADNAHDDTMDFVEDAQGGRSSVRDIVTWKEAIGMIIDANIQNHARTQQSSHHASQGQRDSRGRGRGGRGRGGNRR
jgi:hypothetical protein